MMKSMYWILLALLAACTPAQIQKGPNLAPLSTIVPRIQAGMGLAEVQKNLAGHQPVHQFSQNNETIWEIRERVSDDKINTINANNLLITFDHSGEVSQTLSSFCFLPDQEPPLSASPETNCYQKHIFPFEKETTYDAIKRLLIISHYQVDHSDAQSELISATGTQPFEGDDDKMMFIKLSMAFSPTRSRGTEVVMSASFSASEKQSTWVQAGFGGVTLPVPLPFQSKEEWVDTGIVTPKFYLNFYDALTNLIAREYLPYTPVISKAATPKSTANNPVQSLKPTLPTDNQPYTVPPKPINPAYTFDNELDNLKGPIDASPKAKSKPTQKANLRHNEADNFSDLQGKPIDSQ